MTAETQTLKSLSSTGLPSAYATRSVTEASDFLREQLLTVIRRHTPEIEAVVRDSKAGAGLEPRQMARALQAQGILFQLVSIAEQAYAMRRRRRIEREKGHDKLLGTFDYVLSSAAASGVAPDEIRAQLQSLRIRPVITGRMRSVCSCARISSGATPEAAALDKT